MGVVSLLHRQIFKELITLFLFFSAGFLFLLLLARTLRMQDILFGLGVNAGDIFLLFMYLVPNFLPFTLPISCMFSVFLTFSRMGTDLEVVALQAAGVSLYQMLLAPVLFCILCMVLNFWVSFDLMSSGRIKFRQTVHELARTKATLKLQPGVFNTEFSGLTLFSRSTDPATGELFDIFIKDRTHKDIIVLIIAPSGHLTTNSDLGKLFIQLRDGHIYRQKEGEVSTLFFEKYTVGFDLSMFFSQDNSLKKMPEMSFTELRAASKNPEIMARKNGEYGKKILVEIQKRLVLPVACFVLGLFVLPLAVSFRGLNRHWGVILTLGLFFTYYSLFSAGLALGESGTLPPVVGLWFPNVLFFSLGVWGFIMAVKERLPNVHFLQSLWKRQKQGKGAGDAS